MDISSLESNVPLVERKNTFEESLEKLDLQGVLMLLTVLSERALYLQKKEFFEKKQLVKPKNILHL